MINFSWLESQSSKLDPVVTESVLVEHSRVSVGNCLLKFADFSKRGLLVLGKQLILLRWFLEACQGKVYTDLMGNESLG